MVSFPPPFLPLHFPPPSLSPLTSPYRYSISDHGSTLRVSPVKEEDDEKSLWCNLLVFDVSRRRWRPRKTIRHFLYVGAGKMKLTPQDLMNLGESRG